MIQCLLGFFLIPSKVRGWCWNKYCYLVCKNDYAKYEFW